MDIVIILVPDLKKKESFLFLLSMTLVAVFLKMFFMLCDNLEGWDEVGGGGWGSGRMGFMYAYG